MKKIKLTQGKFAMVDDEDFQKLNKHKWHAIKSKIGIIFYAARTGIPKNTGHILLHREIMNAPDGVPIDHKDNNGLNNTKENLRFCTSTQNQANKRKGSGKKYASKFKGVTRHKRDNTWQATICMNYKNKYLGNFSSEKEAAIAYNDAAKIYFGEFARLNVIN